MSSYNLLICCPNWRHIGLECHRGLLQVAAALTPHEDKGAWGDGAILWGGVTYNVAFLYAVQTNMPFAREYLVDAALDLKADFSVHVDADTGFEMSHVFSLVELLSPPELIDDSDFPNPIVGATLPVALRHAPHNIAAFPFAMTKTCGQDWWRTQERLVNVAGCGMGIFAFTVQAALTMERPFFPVFDNRHGARACPVEDMPLWLTTPQAMTVGSDVGFTARLAEFGRVVMLVDLEAHPVRHVVEMSCAPFERTEFQGGPGAGKKAY